MDWTDRIGRRLKLRDLHILLAVVQAGNMSKAAQQLSVSNPVVTRAVADLERALGVRLLDRTPRGVELTVFGRALLKRGVVAFDELRQAVKDVEFLARPLTGEVRIASNYATGVRFVAPIVERLSRRYPNITFHVIGEVTTATLQHLEERSVDLVIGRLFDSPADHFDEEVLYDDPFIVAAGPRSPWHQRRKIALSDLADEAWALPPLDSPFGALVAKAFAESGLALPRAAVVTPSVWISHALCESGRFLTIVPACVVRAPAQGKALKELLVDLPIRQRPIGILTLKNRTISPAAQLVIDCARELAQTFRVRLRN